MVRKNQRGYNLLEVLIAAVFVGMAALLVQASFRLASSSQTNFAAKQGAETELVSALHGIVLTGRFATSCTKDTSVTAPAVSPALQCNVNPRPNTGNTLARFVLVQNVGPDKHATVAHNHFNYEEKLSAAATSWTTLQTFLNISNIEICSDSTTDMLCTVSPCPCTDATKWTPPKIATQYAALTPAPTSGRFFRVRLTATPFAGKAITPAQLQTAFFVRNGAGQVAYQ